MKCQTKLNTERVLAKINDWYTNKPLGQSMLKAEQAQVTRLIANCFGYHLVQLGGIHQGFFFNKSPICHKVRLSPEQYSHFPGPSIRGDFNELPLASASVDVIVLPHILEFSQDPERVLSEAYRALIPEGKLIIVGFNPYSTWGVFKFGFKQSLQVVANARFYSAYRVTTWLNKLGVEIETKKTGFFRFPFSQESLLLRTTFLETMGQLCWPGCGAFYVIVAKKVIEMPTLVGPSAWAKKLAALPRQARVVSPSARKGLSE